MSWKIFMATFGLVFFAELGDKTQLAVMLQSAVHGRWVVFAAASLALVLSTLLGVYLGGLISKVASKRLIHGVGGVLFLVFGAFMLYSAELNAFDDDTQKLLVEMATDIGFALEIFAREAGATAQVVEKKAVARPFSLFGNQSAMVLFAGEK